MLLLLVYLPLTFCYSSCARYRRSCRWRRAETISLDAAKRMRRPGRCRPQSQRTRGTCHADVMMVSGEDERRTMRSRLRRFEMVLVERFSSLMRLAGRCRPVASGSVSYTHLTLPTILRV